MSHSYVYILANRKNGTLYIGVTSNLARRVYEHREGFAEGFTKKYGIKQLVHVEESVDMRDAIEREKRLKKWNREWKIRIIEESNPSWRDLYNDIIG